MGFLDRLIDDIFDSIKQKKIDDFRKNLHKTDPELAKRIKETNQRLDEIKAYQKANMTKREKKEYEKLKKKYNI